jgi:hypothetical protein
MSSAASSTPARDIMLYPALMVLAVIVTANHWVLDAVAGVALVWVSHLLARVVEAGPAKVESARDHAPAT